MGDSCDTCTYYKEKRCSDGERNFSDVLMCCTNGDCPHHADMYVWMMHCPFWKKRPSI